MIDPTIRCLLEQAVDSPIKLQLLLLFHENPSLEATSTQIAQRIFRDIWSTREALRELAEDGILVATPGRDEPTYRYRPAPDLIEPIQRLIQSYNEPLERDSLHRALRQIAGDAPYRRAMRRGQSYEAVAM
ncbi:MAG: hypothetical protein DIU80_004550 [Chloroflexota bacterium]|nr:MAG: hypothetical protein DIU80_10410 [Chloroflexota bacterium]